MHQVPAQSRSKSKPPEPVQGGKQAEAEKTAKPSAKQKASTRFSRS